MLRVRDRHRLVEMTAGLPGASLQKDSSVSLLPAWCSWVEGILVVNYYFELGDELPLRGSEEGDVHPIPRSSLFQGM